MLGTDICHSKTRLSRKGSQIKSNVIEIALFINEMQHYLLYMLKQMKANTHMYMQLASTHTHLKLVKNTNHHLALRERKYNLRGQ